MAEQELIWNAILAYLLFVITSFVHKGDRFLQFIISSFSSADSYALLAS